MFAIYNETLTILNKLKASDTMSKQDLWFKHVIQNGAWYMTNETSMSGTTVNISSKITILIPNNSMYQEYNVWKQGSNQLAHFTMSTGDYIVKGLVDEEITSQNITKILSMYGNDVCSVKSVRELPNRGIANVMLKVEGV